MDHSAAVTNPKWTIWLPLAANAAVALLLFGFVSVTGLIVPLIVAGGLCASVFSSVHHAEVIAAKVGEPLGSLVLALAVTVLEVGLIVSLMMTAPDGGPTIARDTVYSAIMIITTGIMGLCMLLGNRRHFEQNIRVRGTMSILSVLTVLAVITLILPNFTKSTIGPSLNAMQLGLVALTSLVLYGTFLFVHTVRHRSYFLPEGMDDEVQPLVSKPVLISSAVLLVVALFAVIMLAKSLSPIFMWVNTQLGLPYGFTGVIIATLVLLPEGMAATRAALANKLQLSINLALGSGLATIGLTIPCVALVTYFGGLKVELGVNPVHAILLTLALFISAITLGNGRTNILHGVVHLSIFVMFLLFTAIP